MRIHTRALIFWMAAYRSTDRHSDCFLLPHAHHAAVGFMHRSKCALLSINSWRFHFDFSQGCHGSGQWWSFSGTHLSVLVRKPTSQGRAQLSAPKCDCG